MMLTLPAFAPRAPVVHGFTCRSDDRGEPLDLGTGASPATWAGVAARVGLPGAGIALVSQVHGNHVIEATGPGLAGEADAVWTRQPRLLVAVRTADCVPILVVGPGVVAAIHAGWRGVAAGVVEATFAALPGSGPWQAAVGPAIGVGGYEVGEEVVEGILAAGPPRSVFVRRGAGPRPHVDLKAAVAWQLRRAGCAQVTVSLWDTWSDSRFYSYRRDGAGGGRLAAVVGLR